MNREIHTRTERNVGIMQSASMQEGKAANSVSNSHLFYANLYPASDPAFFRNVDLDPDQDQDPGTDLRNTDQKK
jgi:hypothetical protein